MAAQRSERIYREIGRRIAALRGSHEPPLSQNDLARSIGLSRASVVNIEQGRHRIQIHVLYDVALTLGIDVHDLIPNADLTGGGTSLPASFAQELTQRERTAIERLVKREKG